MRNILGFVAGVLAAIGLGVGALAVSGGGALAMPHPRSTGSKAPAARPKVPTLPAVLPAMANICEYIPAITGGMVVREVTLTQNHLAFPMTRAINFAGAAAARRAARLFCRLPLMKQGAYSCPVDLGVTYKVYFDLSGRTLAGWFDPWGCEDTGGAFGQRWIEGAPDGFWRVLGDTLGVPYASRTTFAGQLGVSSRPPA